MLKSVFQVDYREIEALHAEPEPGFYNEAAGFKELWLDYIADTGDGWNATFTVFSAAAAETLEVHRVGGQGQPMQLRRAQVLLLGGDEVYPYGTVHNYQQRLINPMEASFPKPSGWHRFRKGGKEKQKHLKNMRQGCQSNGWFHARASLQSMKASTVAEVTSAFLQRQQIQASTSDLWAIPGNHDWYDGLVSFTRLFCEGRMLGGWRTKQTRSYFVLSLPHRWWLVGVDIRLQQDIDRHQLEYFQRVHSEFMADGDHIIIATPEPDWVWAHFYNYEDLNRNLALLDNLFVTQNLVLYLSGDLHHYRRHASRYAATVPSSLGGGAGEYMIHKIVAGGGGAFLHPTHGRTCDNIMVNRVPFDLQAEWPPKAVSRGLSYRNLFFHWYNWRFCCAAALGHVMVSWHLPFDIGYNTSGDQLIAQCLVLDPGSLLVSLIFLFFFWNFTDSKSMSFRLFIGGLHALAHWLSSFAGSYLASMLVFGWLVPNQELLRNVDGELEIDKNLVPLIRLVELPLAFVFGFVSVGILFGLYLIIALNIFGAHVTEAFSSIMVEDWKNFLKLHIDADGNLTIYPLGIERVPKKWVTTQRTPKDGENLMDVEGEGSSSVDEIQAAPSEKVQWQLIEEPVIIPGPKAASSKEDLAPPATPRGMQKDMKPEQFHMKPEQAAAIF